MATLHNGMLRPDDDPVVEEVPIFLSKRLAKQMYIFQYPLRPKNNANVVIQRSQFKPNHKQVQLEMSINTQSYNFDSMRAEDLARRVDASMRDSSSKKKEKEKVFANNIVDKIIYTSSQVVPDTKRYAIGAYHAHNKEFHLTPLEGFVQMHPTLDFIDKCMKQNKKDTSDEFDEEAGPSNAQAVTVKFARNEMDKNLKAKELTYKQLKEKADAEKWIDCSWYGQASAESQFLRDHLFAENLEDTGQMSSINPAEYVKLLVPDDQEQAVIKPSLPSHVVSLHSLRVLPVQEQCRLLLKDTKMIQFQQLMLLLASGKGITQDAVIKSLPQVAVLVRGNWVAKSEILYPENSFSAVSGVAAEQMCKARDYVLYLFTKQDYVERRKVSQTIRLPTEEVKEIFTGISKLKHNKGWELLLPEDTDFIAKHSDLAERQKRLWEQRWQQLNEFYKVCPRVERKRKKSRSIGADYETTVKVEAKAEICTDLNERMTDKFISGINDLLRPVGARHANDSLKISLDKMCDATPKAVGT